MKKAKIVSSQSGIAHLGLILAVVVLLGAGYLVYWRFSSSGSDSGKSVSTSETSSEEQLNDELDTGLDELESTEKDLPSEEEEITNE